MPFRREKLSTCTTPRASSTRTRPPIFSPSFTARAYTSSASPLAKSYATASEKSFAFCADSAMRSESMLFSRIREVENSVRANATTSTIRKRINLHLMEVVRSCIRKIVPNAPLRQNIYRTGRVHLDYFPQAADMDIHRAQVALLFPDKIQEALPIKHMPRVQEEQL